jgi:hypothetical protein
VAEIDGRVAGFVSYCHLELLGRRMVRAAVIDLLSLAELPAALQKKLLRAALHQMAAEGCHLALLLRISTHPTWPLVATGFIAQPPEYYYVAQSMGRDVFTAPVSRLHIHWR